MMQVYHVAGIPHTVLIDQGRAPGRHRGIRGVAEILAERIKTLRREVWKSEQEFKDLRVKGKSRQPANVFYVGARRADSRHRNGPSRLIGVSESCRGAAPWSAGAFRCRTGVWIHDLRGMGARR